MAEKKPETRVSDYIITRLVAEGVEDIFLLPGGGAMHLNDAIARAVGLKPVMCHHEQACGIAAEAYGRTHTAGFGVAVVTTGPGSTNILTPVAGAWIESLPLLVISGQVKRPDALNGRPIRQGGVQEVDAVSMAKPVTKYAVTINDPRDVRKCLDQALWHMKTGRRGSVWIEVPLDVQAALVQPEELECFSPPVQALTDSEMDRWIDQINSLVGRAKRPIFLIGHGLRVAGGVELFRKIAAQLGIPCTFTWNAADILAWDDPLYVGRPGVVAARAPNFAIQNSDCLISIGCRLDNVITAYSPMDFARTAHKIVVDVDPHELARHPMAVDVSVCCDARTFLEFWSSKLPGMPDLREWRERCHVWKERYTALEGRDTTQSGIIGHFQAVDRLSDAIGENRLVVTGSSGLAVEVFYMAFRNKPGQRVFLTSGLGSMGYGLPAAIGACIGTGRSPTVCIESDGSLMLNLQELATLKALSLPITLVIMNNNGYASIRNTQRNYFDGRYIGSGKDSGLWIPDFTAVAAAMGIRCERIVSADQIRPELFDDEMKIVEVLLEEEVALTPKVAAMPQADGSIISMPLEDMIPLLPREVLRQEMLIPLHPASEKIDA
jgi:acetolactate synthase-1/2/3 large subunit